MKNRRAQALVVVAVVAGALLMVAAGLSLIAEEPSDAVATPSPPLPSRSGRRASETAPPRPPALTRAAPLPNATSPTGVRPPSGMYPPNTRVGIPAVDEVLKALEQRDGDALARLIRMTPIACSNEAYALRPCEIDEPEGMVADAFFSASCHGGYTRDADVAAARVRDAVRSDLWLYQVYEKTELAESGRGYAIVVGPDPLAPSFELWVSDRGGIVGVVGGCGAGFDPDLPPLPVLIEASTIELDRDILVSLRSLYAALRSTPLTCRTPCTTPAASSPATAMSQARETCDYAVSRVQPTARGFNAIRHGVHVWAIQQVCILARSLRVPGESLEKATPTPGWEDEVRRAIDLLSAIPGTEATPEPPPVVYPPPDTTPTPVPYAEIVSAEIGYGAIQLFGPARQATSGSALRGVEHAFTGAILGDLRDGYCHGKSAPILLRNYPGFDPALHAAGVDRLVAACHDLDTIFAGNPSLEDLLRTGCALKAEFAADAGYPLKFAPGKRVVVDTGSDDRMITRAGPGLSAAEIARVPNGTAFFIDYGPVEADGYYWWRFRSGEWAASANLRAE